MSRKRRDVCFSCPSFPEPQHTLRHLEEHGCHDDEDACRGLGLNPIQDSAHKGSCHEDDVENLAYEEEFPVDGRLLLFVSFMYFYN